MKKITALLIIFGMLAIFVACDGNDGGKDDDFMEISIELGREKPGEILVFEEEGSFVQGSHGFLFTTRSAGQYQISLRHFFVNLGWQVYKKNSSGEYYPEDLIWDNNEHTDATDEINTINLEENTHYVVIPYLTSVPSFETEYDYQIIIIDRN